MKKYKLDINISTPRKDPQYYSKIARKYCIENDTLMVTRGNLNMMEDLLDLFGADREKLKRKATSNGVFYYSKYTTLKSSYVLDRLDRESQKPNALFEKGYICYNGIINRPTRCFTLK